MTWKDMPDGDGFYWTRWGDGPADCEVAQVQGGCYWMIDRGMPFYFHNAKPSKWLRLPVPPDRLALAQSLAYAVLLGDEVAALALADALQEQRKSGAA